MVASYASVDRAPPNSGAVAVLLEDNTLLILNGTGRVLHRVRLGRPTPQPLGARYLALGQSGSLVVVVSGRSRDVLVLASRRGRVIRRIALPKGIHFRAIETGRSGLIFLAGEVATTHAAKFGTLAKRAVFTVMSPAGRLLSTTTLRRPDGERPGRGPLDWSVYDTAVNRDDRRVYVSYHGPNTGGADWVNVGRGLPRRCSSASESEPCIKRVHGSIAAYEAGILATLGTPPLLGRFSADGRQLRVWRSGFRNAHLMEAARNGHLVFTIESCVKTEGMTVVDLQSGRARTLHASAPVTPLRGLPASAVCGERIAVGTTGLIAVMKRGTLSGIGGLMLLDARGRLLKWIRMKPPPVDALVIA